MKPPVTIPAKLARLRPVPFFVNPLKLTGAWEHNSQVNPTVSVYVVRFDTMPVAAYFPPHPYWGDPLWLIALDDFPPAPIVRITVMEGLRRSATARRKQKPQFLATTLAKVRAAVRDCFPAPAKYGARLITFI